MKHVVCEVGSEQLFSSNIHTYNTALLHLSDFVHQFSEGGLIFASCKCNYVFFSSSEIYTDNN